MCSAAFDASRRKVLHVQCSSRLSTSPAPSESAIDSAIEAGLRYVTDRSPGISRHRSGRGFRYFDSNGKQVKNADVLGRIRSLVIPPNWREVWICRDQRGHLQATGRDARNRKQYRYHAKYRAVREETKFQKMIAFGQTLPTIRRRVEHDLSLPGLPREKVVATVVRLMDVAHIRVGNEEYARQNRSFGLTTMRDRHVEIEGATMHFQFRGKSGKEHSIELQDKRLANIVKRCQDIPGYELFQYVDENGRHAGLDSGMVNEYLRETAGEDLTAKDFRTWHGTVCAAEQLRACEFKNERELKTNVVAAVQIVAEHLGNRPATCRKYYVHPAILELYASRRLKSYMAKHRGKHNLRGLASTERCVLRILLETAKER